MAGLEQGCFSLIAVLGKRRRFNTRHVAILA
jgi:hypothetical protein